MIKDIMIEAEPRTDSGKGPARRLRVQGRIPIAVYGEGLEPVAASINVKDIQHILRSDTGHNTIFKLKVGKSEPSTVIMKDWQLDPVRGKIIHADLLRLSMTTMTRVSVSVEVLGEPFGVKTEGGILDIMIREVEIECLPGDIPQSLKLDVTELHIGDHVSVSDLVYDSEKIKLITDVSLQVAGVLHPRLVEAPVVAAPVEIAPTEPEVIKKGKTEE